jgi:hypothetical protein
VKIVFAGSIGRFPLGGHAWANMQYLAGLRDLGHEVVYLEECGEDSWVYKWEIDEVVNDLSYPTGYVQACLEPIGLGNRWIYRAGERSEGMVAADFLDYCADADLLIVRAVPLSTWRPEYTLPRRRIFIDVDPGFTHIRLANGDRQLCRTVEQCDRLFTIAQRLDCSDCEIPTGEKPWVKTVSPVWLRGWPAVEKAATEFTMILQWESYTKSHPYGKTEHNGVRYEQKNKELLKFLDLPKLTGRVFQMALTGGPHDELTERGWDVVQGWKATRTPEKYRAFIVNSGSELGIAKHGYVSLRGGWFSDRSACYLASGKPVLVQDTGLRDWLPAGEGLLTFTNVDDARKGVEAICADYPRHRKAARRLAETQFSTERVLPPLLEAAMN